MSANNEYEKELELRAQDIQGNTIEALQVLMDLDDAVEELDRLRTLYPLQTIQSMAERWGVQRQTVNNWLMRRDDFPKPLEGVIAATARTPLVFSNADMLRYERNRGLSNLTDAHIEKNGCIS